MDIIKSIENYPQQSKPTALTIGMFDGCHLGHKKLIDTLLSLDVASTVFTYSNHPRSILTNTPYPLIQSSEDKLHRLKSWGVDYVLLQEFTTEFASATPVSFLERMRNYIPFTHLVIGYDTTIGKGKSADTSDIQTIAKSWNIETTIVTEEKFEEVTISSSWVKDAIIKGDLELLEKLLGRKYSLYGTTVPGAGMGKKLGFPTLNFPVEGLILPPLGVYAIHYVTDHETVPGIANLGISPTIKNTPTPTLEVHLFEPCNHSTPAEVVFQNYIRPEMKFPSIDALKIQIAKDILVAKQTIFNL